jgi:hypothetical protein
MPPRHLLRRLRPVAPPPVSASPAPAGLPHLRFACYHVPSPHPRRGASPRQALSPHQDSCWERGHVAAGGTGGRRRQGEGRHGRAVGGHPRRQASSPRPTLLPGATPVSPPRRRPASLLAAEPRHATLLAPSSSSSSTPGASTRPRGTAHPALAVALPAQSLDAPLATPCRASPSPRRASPRRGLQRLCSCHTEQHEPGSL